MKLNITNGMVLIDKDDYDLISKYKWHINDQGYVIWRGIEDGKKKTIRMHRLIMNTPQGLVTDHINHNRADNRKANLRICTQSDNMRNLRNQGKGYWKHSQNNNWVVDLYSNHIGCFATEMEAQAIVKLIRSGGIYIKPAKTHCRYGHSLENAYIVNGKKQCKLCQDLRSKEYYRRKHAN